MRSNSMESVALMSVFFLQRSTAAIRLAVIPSSRQQQKDIPEVLTVPPKMDSKSGLLVPGISFLSG